MIKTKIISIFLSICILISCVSFSFAAEDIPDIDITSSAEPILGQFQMKAEKQSDNSEITVVSNIEYLPCIKSTPAGYQISSYTHPSFMLQNNSEKGFDGYYSLYLCLVFYSTGNQSDITASNLNYLTNLKLTVNNQTIVPKINISSTFQSDWLPVNNSYYFIKTVWLKWDFHHTSAEGDRLYTLNSTWAPDMRIVLTRTDINEYWICSILNMSVVKYEDAATQANYSESFDDILSYLSTIRTNIYSYYPQFVHYLQQIDLNTDTLESLIDDTNEQLEQIYNDFDYYLDSIINNQLNLYSLLETALTSNTRTTIYWMLFELTKSLTYQGSIGSGSLYRILFSNDFYASNIFDYSYDDDLDQFSFSSYVEHGLLHTLQNIVQSINNLLIYDFNDKQNLINSVGYQTGQDVSDNINSAGGYAGLSGVGSDLSGIGNMALIPSIFNGIGSAFRWFTNDTKNNLDMVPQTRGEQETISHYYYDNQAAAESILVGDADD